MDKLIFTRLKNEVLYNHNLSRYSAWRTGGVADIFYQPYNLEDLQTMLSQIPDNYPIHWLGLGSNTLFRDKGFRGLVIRTNNGLGQFKIIGTELFAMSGVPVTKLAKQQIKYEMGGIEFFSGIPGSVGGALIMNAGCDGYETWGCVSRVKVIIPEVSTEICELDRSQFEPSYRSVKIKNNNYKKIWFLGAWFKLKKQSADITKNKINTLLDKRNQTQPIGTANCGSVFKNPKGEYAAELIERAGLKGFSIGNAQLSTKHCNFIINNGNATSSDIERLITLVKRKIKNKFNLDLYTEVNIVGEAG